MYSLHTKLQHTRRRYYNVFIINFKLINFHFDYVCLSVKDGDIVKRPLDRFVGHYEHIHYDKDKLMHHHRRVRKSLPQNDEGIVLSFDAFDKYAALLSLQLLTCIIIALTECACIDSAIIIIIIMVFSIMQANSVA